MYIQGYF